MTALPLRDFTAAERAKLAAIEAAPAAEESVRLRVARALFFADAEWMTPAQFDAGWTIAARHDRDLAAADAALAVLRGPSSDAVLPMCWDLAPTIHLGDDSSPQYRCELPHGHGGAHQSSQGNHDFPMCWIYGDDQAPTC